MLWIAHRVNTVEQLEQTPAEYGVEIDVRERGSELILQHDPGRDGERLRDYLARFRHRFLILNVKTEGIEEEAIRRADERGVAGLFVLDAAVPAMVRLARRGERRFAVRFSEYEPIEGCLALAGLATWIWVDCFTDYPARPAQWKDMRRRLRVCLVSPELQGRMVPAVATAAAVVRRFAADAVCTKQPDAWRAAVEGAAPVSAARGRR